MFFLDISVSQLREWRGRGQTEREKERGQTEREGERAERERERGQTENKTDLVVFIRILSVLHVFVLLNI